MIQQDDDERFLSTEYLGTEAIITFVDGGLSVVAERRAQAHLMACPECHREIVKQWQAAKRLRGSAPLHTLVELRARIADFAGSCEDSEPHRSARHLAHRLPESLNAALEQIARGFRKGGSHQQADITLLMIPRLLRAPIVPPQLVGYSMLQGKSLTATPVPPSKSIRRGRIRRHV